ncbi:MAG: hypothetical protein L0219_06015 [Phycisphaerales bacterium]|nr:hypothetical protein [Phycisphaerales bacterium]
MPTIASTRVEEPRQAAYFRGPANPPETGPDSAPVEPPTQPPAAVGFPPIAGIQWEFKEQGTVVEAWYAPNGGRNRAGKQYLGRFGKRRIAQLPTDAADRGAEIRAQIETWKEQKGAK